MNLTARLSLLAASGTLLASTSAAQVPMHNNWAEHYERMFRNDYLEWPGTATHPAPSFKRLVAGDFRADGEQDVAVHEGDRAYVWHDVTYANLLLPIATSDVNDIDLAPTTSGQPDQLALVRSTGLFSANWPASLSTPPTLSAVSTTNPNAWLGAKLVRCADFDADGVTDYVGLASDGLTVLRLVGGGGNPTDSFVAPDTVQDLGLLLWDLDAPRELAIATTQGMYVHELVGATTWSPAETFDSGFDCRRLAVLRGVIRNRLAWVADLGATEELRVARLGLAVETVQLPLGTEVVGLCGADADGDGYLDLMFNTRTHLAPYFVKSYAPAIPAFAPSINWTYSLVDDDPTLTGAVASNNNCPPLFHDFNGDGNADLFLALEQTGQVLDQAPAAVYMPWTPTAGYANKVSFLAGGIHLPPDTNGLRSLDLRITGQLLPTVQNVTANALEVIVYRQTEAGEELEEYAVAWQLYDVSYFSTETSDDMRIAVQFQDDACFESTVQGETNLYWFELWPRTVDWNSPGAPEAPTIIRNHARRFVGVGANELDVCDYLCNEEGTALALDDAPTGTEFESDECVGAGSPNSWECVASYGEGTTQGPAAVIRIRLPVRNGATQFAGPRVFMPCAPCVY